jgi:hypothetical protein
MATVIVVSSLDGILKGVATGWFTLLFKDLILWIAVIRWLAMRRTGQYAPVPRVSTVTIIIVFVLWVCAEAANVFTGSVLVALAGIRSWVGWMPMFFVTYQGIQDRRALLRLCQTIVVAAGLVGAYGLIQQRVGYDHLLRIGNNFSYVQQVGATGAELRAISTLPYPGIFGHYMAAVVPMAMALVFVRFLPIRQRLICGLCAFAIAGGALASGGRLAFASLLTCAVLVLLLWRRARAMVAGLVVVAFLIMGAMRLVAPQSLERVMTLFHLSVSVDRILHPFRQGWRAIQAYPLGTGVASGVGIGRAAQLLGRVELDREAAGMIEGDFGRAFRELGVPGGLLFCYLIGHVLSQALQAHRAVTDPAWRLVSGALVAMVVAEVLGLLVGPAFYLMPVAGLFWIAYAGLLRLAQTESSSPHEFTDAVQLDLPVTAGSP